MTRCGASPLLLWSTSWLTRHDDELLQAGQSASRKRPRADHGSDDDHGPTRSRRAGDEPDIMRMGRMYGDDDDDGFGFEEV
jgi:hypothetical protein